MLLFCFLFFIFAGPKGSGKSADCLPFGLSNGSCFATGRMNFLASLRSWGFTIGLGSSSCLLALVLCFTDLGWLLLLVATAGAVPTIAILRSDDKLLFEA